eukprot:CAMPEP_0197387044 /NCGR_PEP_ID=MMETSP1165-20131217/289_1 /TAXON_ID=284809 /ORGANISM="Chrysocystis fragilis, Strain CCMP3189" /LENGTH=394 /DNA_ID=CAMNT_0042912341 /DNA_START=153 /DNA_END=1333 /DNA_ORIENTATION=+
MSCEVGAEAGHPVRRSLEVKRRRQTGRVSTAEEGSLDGVARRARPRSATKTVAMRKTRGFKWASGVLGFKEALGVLGVVLRFAVGLELEFLDGGLRAPGDESARGVDPAKGSHDHDDGDDDAVDGADDAEEDSDALRRVLGAEGDEGEDDGEDDQGEVDEEDFEGPGALLGGDEVLDLGEDDGDEVEGEVDAGERAPVVGSGEDGEGGEDHEEDDEVGDDEEADDEEVLAAAERLGLVEADAVRARFEHHRVLVDVRREDDDDVHQAEEADEDLGAARVERGHGRRHDHPVDRHRARRPHQDPQARLVLELERDVRDPDDHHRRDVVRQVDEGRHVLQARRPGHLDDLQDRPRHGDRDQQHLAPPHVRHRLGRDLVPIETVRLLHGPHTGGHRA